NLPAWVPNLNLYKCQRQRGRHCSYIAVAAWRPSSSGRPLEEREPNLKIFGSGITDFGTGKGYSPLDLVMAALPCSRSEAFDWLAERVKKSGVEIDWEKITETSEDPCRPHPGSEEGAEERRSGDAPPPEGEKEEAPKRKGFDLKPYRVKR